MLSDFQQIYLLRKVKVFSQLWQTGQAVLQIYRTYLGHSLFIKAKLIFLHVIISDYAILEVL